MRSKLGCFIFLMIMITSQIFAGNVYYVDATNGNDLNDGLSESSAWKTIAKVNAQSFSPGDFILFKRGEKWIKQLNPCCSGSGGSPITFSDYGSGNKPIITLKDSLSGWDTDKYWTEESSNLWYKTITYNPYRLWLSGTEYLKAETLNDVDATSRWFYDSGASRLYVYATSNPASAYANVEVPYDGTIESSFGGGDNYITLQNLDFRGGRYAIKHVGSTYLTVDNCSVGLDTGRDGFHMRELGVTPMTYLTISNCTIESGHSFVYDYEVSQPNNGIMLMNGCTNASIHDNTISNWGHDCIHLYVQTTGSVSNNEIYDNVISSPNTSYCRGIGLVGPTGTVQNNKIYRNEFKDLTVRMNFCGNNNEFYYNLIHDMTISGISGANISEGLSLAGWTASPTETVCHDNKVYNNVFYNIHNEGIRISDEGIEPTDNIIKNNIFMKCGEGGDLPNIGLWYDSDITTGTQTIENNCFYDAGTASVIHHKGTARTVEYCNDNIAEYGNNIENSDPLMTDPANANFTLQSASPCIDAGMYVWLTEDYVGNTVPYGWGVDIGAFEYTGASPLGAEINASPTSGEVPLTVIFSGNATGGTPPYSYSWDFGDSTSSSEQNPTHTYSQAGDYTVTLTVTDNQSNQNSDSLTINASASTAPLAASFIASPTSGEVPLTVNFTGGATGGTPPYSYNWDFGDSTSSSEQNPTHTYNDPGDYTVTLTVTDSENTQDSDSLTINVSAAVIPFVASCSASSTSGEVPLTVNFTGSATGGVLPYSYSWDFGDSTSSSEQNPSHIYSEAGDYTVYLTVTDSVSNQDNDSLTINASAAATPLEASCVASPTSGNVPLTVNFTGSATGGTEPYTYSWDFGDSTSSSEQNPTHTYSNPGDYTVTLTVTDSQSNQDSDSLIINVNAPAASLEASCAASPTSGEVPLTVNFTGNASGGTPPYSYSWDFGDGTSSSEQIPTHTYSEAGDYTVTLTVTDSQSNQNEDSLIINASALTNPLVASCAASPVLGEVPLTVNFTGIATGGVLPYSYSWDFGDGTSSSEQNPSHIYSQAGDYTAYLTVTDSDSNQDNDSLIINASAATNSAYLSCSPKSFFFGATTSGNETSDQYLRIINAGSGTLTWNIEDDADWLSCSPSSGTDRGEITVSVNASGLSLGLYIATITVSSPEAYNSPQYVSVSLRVYEPEQESPPFGSLDTPVNGSTVSGSIPITGWALDDIEVIRLEIKRNSDPVDLPEAIGSDGLVYIGDAFFVEGARPDVEKSYPDYPLNSRAGWGYMLLTNDLPYRGNGSFTIYTFAYDASGHREEIGRKTILCDNINRVKPFGTIDTPEQGESIRGSDYVNFGWALTPLPKTIPKDGSTIWLWVDGVQVGHPVYDQYREDIATLYPEYYNAQGAVGYYYIDTTQYENGMHTIAWSVGDDEGEADEIGARYFFIDNVETGSVHQGSLGLRRIYREDAERRLKIDIKEVWRENRPRVDDDREIATKSILKIQIEEMEPVRIVLEESSRGNMEYIGWGENKWKALPIGSTLDREKGIFSWIPTPGFIGRYVIHFAVTDGSYMSKPLRVEVNVIPKRDKHK